MGKITPVSMLVIDQDTLKLFNIYTFCPFVHEENDIQVIGKSKVCEEIEWDYNNSGWALEEYPGILREMGGI